MNQNFIPQEQSEMIWVARVWLKTGGGGGEVVHGKVLQFQK